MAGKAPSKSATMLKQQARTLSSVRVQFWNCRCQWHSVLFILAST